MLSTFVYTHTQWQSHTESDTHKCAHLCTCIHSDGHTQMCAFVNMHTQWQSHIHTHSELYLKCIQYTCLHHHFLTHVYTPAPAVEVLGSIPPRPVMEGAEVVLLKMLLAVVAVAPPRPPSPRLGALLAAPPGECIQGIFILINYRKHHIHWGCNTSHTTLGSPGRSSITCFLILHVCMWLCMVQVK